VHEVRRRYEAIGGKSPLLDICGRLTQKLEAALQVPVALAMRLWDPYPKDVLAKLAARGVDRVVVLPLAQHSAHIYGESVAEAAQALAAETGKTMQVVPSGNWGNHQALIACYETRVRKALQSLDVARTHVLFSAHSLPVFIIRSGDAYETEFRASVEKLQASLGAACPHSSVIFQSQGMSKGPGGRPVEWLGPDLQTALRAAKDAGAAHVLVAPVGFLADHVEILYDLDIEAAAWAKELGLGLSRTASLNDDDDFVSALAAVARPMIDA
jgi:ferrochelatase